MITDQRNTNNNDSMPVLISESHALSTRQVVEQVQLIQQVMHSVMKDGEHFGKIPGCGDKPALFKPGAEKLAHTFRLAPKYEEIPGCREDDDFIVYKIRCDLIHMASGQFVGSGLGTCNSREKKYKERSVYENKATPSETAIGRLEERPKKDGGKYKVYIIPQDPWDLQNTLYKMACKRALVAAVLNATAASDIFAQDIDEDEIAEIVREDREQQPERKAPQVQPQRKSEATANQQTQSPDLISEAQRKRLYAIYKNAGITDDQMKDYLFREFGIEHSIEIKKSDYEAICNWAQYGDEPGANG